MVSACKVILDQHLQQGTQAMMMIGNVMDRRCDRRSSAGHSTEAGDQRE
jgi:hypothetical protein